MAESFQQVNYPKSLETSQIRAIESHCINTGFVISSPGILRPLQAVQNDRFRN